MTQIPGLIRDVMSDEIEQYRQEGVVRLKGILDLEWVELAGEAVEEALYDQWDEVQTSYNNTEYAELARTMGADVLSDERTSKIENPGKFLSNVGAWMVNEKLKRLCTESPLGFISGRLFGSHKVNLYDAQCFMKEPSSKEYTAYHTDEPYFHVKGDNCLTCWVSPDVVTSESGAMKYVRKSHQMKESFKANAFVTQSTLQDLGFAADLEDQVLLPDIEHNEKDYDVVMYTSNPGDVIAHHYRAIHGSGPNYTKDLKRRAAAITFSGDDARYFFRQSAPPQPHHSHSLKDGDVMDSDQFPVVCTL